MLGNVVDLPLQEARLVPVIYLGLCGFFLIGFVDDIRSLPPLPRLVAQLVVALCVVIFSGDGGLLISSAFGQYIFPYWLAVAITVLWIVGVVNTFNWIDGLDGLAAGVAGISAAAFLILAFFKPGLPNATLTAALCAVLIGSVLGFLPYNLHRARIFLGDGGAFCLGYLLAVTSVVGLFKQAAVISFIVPVAILALPIGDTIFAIARRLWRGQPVLAPDNRHIHHRILALLSRGYRRKLPYEALGSAEERQLEGRAHRNTVFGLYAFAATFAALAVGLGLRP